MFELTILGSSSATPTSSRNPSAQYLNFNERHILIDCGEGTQSRLRANKIKMNKIKHILISHLHGDHYFGLIGLLSSLHLLDTNHEIHLYCTPQLKEIIDLQLKHSDTWLKYPLVYHFYNPKTSELIFEDDVLSIYTIPLKHRVPCTGFLFKEKERQRTLKKELISVYNLTPHNIVDIKNGANFIDETGREISNEILTNPAPKGRSYAYCSDTIFDPDLVGFIQNVDLLYHESTFLEDKLQRAYETYHSTAKQAAEIARLANAKQLLIGHFSARYKDLNEFKKEAKEIFSNSHLALEGLTFRL
jgi:ribonuclease Z